MTKELISAWILAIAAGWTFGRSLAVTQLAEPPAFAPLPGASIRSVPDSPGVTRPAALPRDGADVDFEQLVFDDYDPPALRQDETPLTAADFPEAARGLDGRRVSIVGFSQVLRVADGQAEQVMVSRYPPGCCFGAVPVFDEWVLVELEVPVDVVSLPSIVRASGELHLGETLGEGRAVESLYRLRAAELEAY